MKQIRFGLKIGAHDLEIKMNKVTKFIEAGHKVKITLFYRGREQAHKEIGFKIAAKVIEDFGDTIIVDQQPQLAGKQLSFVVRHSGKKAVPIPTAESVAEAKATEASALEGQKEGDIDAKTKDA